MKQKLMYVELKTGYNDNGPAWIGMASFSKTRQTVYFNGLIFLKGERHSGGNHLEYFTGDSYWVSGIKKTGKDRHWAGGGKIKIDKQVVELYLETTKLSKLLNDKFDLVDFEDNQQIQDFNILENKKLETL